MIFYYWFFVAYSEKIDKPKNIANKYVDLDGNMYENDRIIKKTNTPWDYSTQSNMNPFDYTISFQNNNLLFTSLGKQWNVQLTPDFFWTGKQISEKDDCFGKTGKVAAKGKYLFDYIQHHDLIDSSNTNAHSEFSENLNLFYFKCKDEKIESLHKCPPGHIFDDTDCKFNDVCRDKLDDYTYAHPSDNTKYYKCHQKMSVEKQCPAKQIFQFDACKSPDNICEVERDGYRVQYSKYTYGECIGGKMEMKTCMDGYHFYEGKCEYEKCFGKDNELVPFHETKHGIFSLTYKYGKCVNGKLKEQLRCPNNWNTFNVNGADVSHLPQVFENGKCRDPQLCKNVKIIDKDAVVPAFNYRKHLATWTTSALFDRAVGYNCNSNGDLQKVHVPDDSLVIGFKIKNACSAEMTKVPTTRPSEYYDCTDNSVKTCQSNEFFDGSACSTKNPRAFRFNNHLDVFQFENLNYNNWMRARPSKPISYIPTCDADEVYVKERNLCVHPNCKQFLFISELRKPIKLDQTYQCVYDIRRKIKKERYYNPKGLALHFWQQTLGDDSMQSCTVGNKLSTGNFVMDSTVYATCLENQPFVFCPSNATDGIFQVSRDLYACKPKDKVYTQKLKRLEVVHLYVNEVDFISMPSNAKYKISLNNNMILKSTITKSETDLKIADIISDLPPGADAFSFECNKATTLVYKTLVNNPPNTYILNKNIHQISNLDMHYDLVKDKETDKYLYYELYENLKYSLSDFNY